jgi:hypothetical protein
MTAKRRKMTPAQRKAYIDALTRTILSGVAKEIAAKEAKPKRQKEGQP